MKMLHTLIVSSLLIISMGCEIEDSRRITNHSSAANTGSQASSQSSSSQPSSKHTIANPGQQNRQVEELSKELAETRAKNKELARKLEKLVSSEQKSSSPSILKQQSGKTVTFDHSAFDGLLKKYVKDGLVDYKTWKAKDLGILDRYLTSVKASDPSKLATKSEKMAFWINVYNAWTLRSMLSLYPTKSILDHAKGAPKAHKGGIWKANPIIINGKKFTLDQIEHKILRPMGDPRIHFGIVCASIGCPPLASHAYSAGDLDNQLQKNGQAFFADSNKFQVDHASKTVKLSKIFQWFGKDFAASGKDAELLKALSVFAKDKKSQDLMKSGNAKVEYLDYNWNINAQKP